MVLDRGNRARTPKKAIKFMMLVRRAKAELRPLGSCTSLAMNLSQGDSAALQDTVGMPRRMGRNSLSERRGRIGFQGRMFLMVLIGLICPQPPAFARFATSNFAMDGEFLGVDSLKKRSLKKNSDTRQLVVFEQTVDEQADHIRKSFARFARFYERSDDPKEKLKLTRRVQVWQDAGLYDVCQFPGGDEELIFLRPDGLYRFGQATPIVATTTAMPFPSREQFNRFQFCQHLQTPAGKKVLALVVPTITGSDLYIQSVPPQGDESSKSSDGEKVAKAVKTNKNAKNSKYEFKKLQSFNTYADITFFGQMRNKRLAHSFDKGVLQGQNMHVAMEYARVFLADLNGDKLDDVCWAVETFVSCALQNSDGGFSKRADWQRNFAVDSVESGSWSPSTKIHPLLVDLNGDGFSDVVVKLINQNISGMGGELHIFHNQGRAAKGGADAESRSDAKSSHTSFFADTPTQVIKREGFFSYHEFLDINGDGFLDLFFPWVELGWSQLASIYLSKEVKVRFYVAQSKKGMLQPARHLVDVTYPMDFKSWSAITGVLPIWRKDDSGLSATFFPKKTQISRKQLTFRQQTPSFKDELEGDVAVGDEVILFESHHGLEYVMGYVTDEKKRRMFTLVSPAGG